ncbi:MAG: LPS-assembly protein LptD, partial [Xanthobacteraceae bacterium]
MARAFGRFRPGVSGGVRVGVAFVAALMVFAACSLLTAAPASAQNLLHFPERPTQPKPPANESDAPMLVQATEIRYDSTNNTVSAVGNVQLYYNGATVEADEVVYYQKTKRLQARG